MKQKVSTQAQIRVAKEKDLNRLQAWSRESRKRSVNSKRNGLRVQVENSGTPGIGRRSNAEEMEFHRFSCKNK